MSGRLVHWNGVLQEAAAAAVPCDDRGFLAGDGVFETLWVTDGVPVFWAEHVERLRHGLEQVGIPAPCTPPVLAARVRELVAAQYAIAAGARLRITVTAGGGTPQGRRAGPSHVLLTLDPWEPLPPAVYEQGVMVEMSAHRRAPHPLHTIKSTSYAASTWLRREAHSAATFEVLQCNVDGTLAEGSFTNVFVVDAAGTLRTPAPAEGCLPGITRAVVLDLARGTDLPCREGAVPAPALGTAAEVFLTGSLCGIVPVRRVQGAGGAANGAGPVTRRLQELYARRVQQERQRDSIGAANDG